MFLSSSWLCHVDDDIYINTKNLVKLLSKFDHKVEPVYLGKSGIRSKTRRGELYLWAYGGMYCMNRLLLEKAKPYLV